MQGKDYLDFVAAFKETEGFRIYELRKSLSVSYYTFSRNQAELLSLLRRHSNTDTFPNYDRALNRDALHQDFREAIRLLHNSCASIMSLVDHSRRVARKTLTKNQLEEYNNQIEQRFKSNPEHCFLQELRNYLLHHSNAPISRVVRFEPTHIRSIELELSKKSLLEWSWKKVAKEFILSHEDGVAIAPVVLKYGNNVANFLRWLHSYIEQSRKSKFKELWRKHDDWVSFCRSKGIPTTQEEFRKAYEDDTRN